MASTDAKKTKSSKQRKRVNRLKTLILFMATLLLFVSVGLNFVLMFKVLHLEKQMDRLYSTEYVMDDDFC